LKQGRFPAIHPVFLYNITIIMHSSIYALLKITSHRTHQLPCMFNRDRTPARLN